MQVRLIDCATADEMETFADHCFSSAQALADMAKALFPDRGPEAIGVTFRMAWYAALRAAIIRSYPYNKHSSQANHQRIKAQDIANKLPDWAKV